MLLVLPWRKVLDMSMLKTWWSGGGKGDSEEDKSLDCRGEKQAVSPDDSVNPWVKGFGGKLDLKSV